MQAELVLRGGRIFTGLEHRPFAQALSVQPFQLLLPEVTKTKTDSRRVLTLFQRCDDRSREYLSRVMESFVDYEAGT